MSDPMTNTEVEDVLSSIRRLVSDEKRAEPAADAAPTSDRLVLTPSLRVLDDDAQADDAEDAQTDDVTDDTWQADTHAQDDASQAQDTEAQEEEHADSAPMLLEPSVDADIQDHDQAVDAAFDDAGGTEDDHGDAHEGDQHSSDTAEGWEDAVAQTPETLGEKIAALETLIAGRAEEFEPDEAGSDAYAGTEAPAMEWEDAEEDDAPDAGQGDASFAPHVEAAAVMPEPETEAPFLSTDDDVLDEEALRELVSDIVREELQGALGERITRNVRKLVRREIHRALAAQDLE